MPDGSVEMESGMPVWHCPDCGEQLGCGEPVETEHTVTLTSFGVNVDPGLLCPECGLVGKIRRGTFVSTGRLQVPPSDARLAALDPPSRTAVKVEVGHPDPDESYQESGECPNRNLHAHYSGENEPCPICGEDKWVEPELVEEAMEELVEGGEDEQVDHDEILYGEGGEADVE